MNQEKTETLEEVTAKHRAEWMLDSGETFLEHRGEEFSGFVQALLSDPAILAHVPGYVALREENERNKEGWATAFKAGIEWQEKSLEQDKRIADLEAQLAAVQGGEAVAWEYRFNYGENSSITGWSEWEKLQPRGRLETVENRVSEIQTYIDNGLGYELRALYTTPQPAIAGKVREALENAESVIASINAGKQHLVVLEDDRAYWQREEWCLWAINEVLPQIKDALAGSAKK